MRKQPFGWCLSAAPKKTNRAEELVQPMRKCFEANRAGRVKENEVFALLTLIYEVKNHLICDDSARRPTPKIIRTFRLAPSDLLEEQLSNLLDTTSVLGRSCHE